LENSHCEGRQLAGHDLYGDSLRFFGGEDRMSQKTFSVVVGLIFLLITIMHGLRLAFRWQAVLRGPEARQEKLDFAVLIGDYLRASVWIQQKSCCAI
jgi:hypothetical protein